MEHKKHPNRRLRHCIAAPFIWLPLIALIILDIFLEIYHRICFPLYGLEYIKRSDYIKVFDRNRLQYLGFWDKINCSYCGYANGLINYARVIAGTTELYWCGIRHKQENNFHEQQHHKDFNFSKYGDKKAFEKKYCKLNKKNK